MSNVSILRLRAASHAVDQIFLIGLLVSVCLAALAGRVSVELRVGANTTFNGGILDTAVVVGISLPCGVIGWALVDRAAWLSATSTRPAYARRGGVILAMHALALLVFATLALLLASVQSVSMVLADAALLYGLAIASAVLFGGDLGWVLPVCVALVATAPGLVPLDLNVLVALDRRVMCAVLGAIVVAVASPLYVLVGTSGVLRRGPR